MCYYCWQPAGAEEGEGPHSLVWLCACIGEGAALEGSGGSGRPGRTDDGCPSASPHDEEECGSEGGRVGRRQGHSRAVGVAGVP